MTTELDSLLDVTLDDIADLPEYKNFPAGAHVVKATLSLEEIGDAKKPAIKLAMVHVETLDIDPQDTPPNPGDSCSILYFLDNELGQGAFKRAAAVFVEALDLGSSIRAIIEGVKDVECAVVTGLKKDKNDKDKIWLTVKEIKVI